MLLKALRQSMAVDRKKVGRRLALVRHWLCKISDVAYSLHHEHRPVQRLCYASTQIQRLMAAAIVTFDREYVSPLSNNFALKTSDASGQNFGVPEQAQQHAQLSRVYP